MMQDIQEAFRHIPSRRSTELTRLTGVPAYLYHIATFYKTFSLEPKGETTIQVCLGTACHVKGGANLVTSLEGSWTVKSGGTTKDNKYTLDAVAASAPAARAVGEIGDEVHGTSRPKDLERLLRQSASNLPRAAISAAPPSLPPAACACDLGAIRKQEQARAAAYKAC